VTDCRRFEPELSALLDGELPAPEAAAAEAHVRTCRACAAVFRNLAVVGRALREVDGAAAGAPVSASFRARLLERAAAGRRVDAERRSPPLPIPLRRPSPWGSVAAAAALVAGALGGGYALGRLEGGDGGEGASLVRPPETSALPGAAALLARADAHRAAGREDLARRDLLAAHGIAPEDKGVAEALRKAFGMEVVEALPVASPRESASGAAPDGPTIEVESEPADLRIGSWRFESAAAYDEFLAFRERARAVALEAASREEALAAAARGTTTVAAVRTAPAEPDPLARALAALEVGEPRGGDGSPAWQGLTVYPLRRTAEAPAGADPAAGIATLAEALPAGTAVVAEAAGRRSGEVLVTNRDAARPLLVLAGTILDGGRADRMVVRDVLLPAGARSVPVPVCSVEACRAAPAGAPSRFPAVAGSGGAHLRALALGLAPAEEIRAFVGARLDVLDVTALRRSLADAHSDRGPAAPALRAIRPRVQDLLRALQDPAVVGFAVAHQGALLGAEVFGSHDLMAREARRILEGAALEASTWAGGGAPPSREAVAAALAAAGRGTAVRSGADGKAVAAGEGVEVGLLAREAGLLGAGVARGAVLLHASILSGGGPRGRDGRPVREGGAPAGSGPPAAADGAGGQVPPGGSGPGEGGGSDTSGGGTGGGPTDPPPPPGERPR
jgi:hypothetical protein